MANGRKKETEQSREDGEKSVLTQTSLEKESVLFLSTL
jgi:hypothetical protein